MPEPDGVASKRVLINTAVLVVVIVTGIVLFFVFLGRVSPLR